MRNEAPPILELDVQHRAQSLSLDIAFHLSTPWTVIFGPSGSGKTTVLRAIAGFIKPRSGFIRLGATVLFDSASRTCLRPHDRPVRSGAQLAHLFPNLSVRQNVEFGIPASPGRVADQAVAAALIEEFGLDALSERRPCDLSGGEKQRVSLARTLVSVASAQRVLRRTPLLLLDEPFSGLDLRSRDNVMDAVLSFVRTRDIPVLSVTHDVGEAFRLGCEVLRVEAGRLADQGPVATVLSRERDLILKELAG